MQKEHAVDLERGTPALVWWLQDEERQNFGDYLTPFLWSNLSEGPLVTADVYCLIGSAIHEGIIRDLLLKQGKWEDARIVFWCCGMREDTPPNAESLAKSHFCGVRGPLTRRALRLPDSTAIGDPGLLLPLFYKPRRSAVTAGKTVCIPHFLDPATDNRLREITGADVVVRPSINKSSEALTKILDEIASADFVLAGSLHAAIIACAYNVPFCYFDVGYVDVPFKWRDFSASINIGSFFVDNVADGRKIYDGVIRDRLQKPLLFPILAAAPFQVRSLHLLQAARHDAQQLGLKFDPDVEAFAHFRNWADEHADMKILHAQLTDVEGKLSAEASAHAMTQRVLAEREQALADIGMESAKLQVMNADLKVRCEALDKRIVQANAIKEIKDKQKTWRGLLNFLAYQRGYGAQRPEQNSSSVDSAKEGGKPWRREPGI